MLRFGVVLPLLLGAVCVSSVWAEVVIETVPVGNPGNADDNEGDGYGGVDYVYTISKFEITAGQYCGFLNSVAREDAYGLYNPIMDSSADGCQITRNGTPGNYVYDFSGRPSGSQASWENRPVNYVSWGDAARFCNWLHNGQPEGAQDLSTTEDGSYSLNGATSNAALLSVDREPDATWVIPSEDEWYKAAYYRNDGVTGNYWDYPTASDSVPTSQAPPGTDPLSGSANYLGSCYAIGSPYYRTEVGAYDARPSDSPHGTFDQGGNVWEWNEAMISGSYRGLRGGSFANGGFALRAANRNYIDPANEYDGVGFRVATAELMVRDCNNNDIPDDQDIAADTSQDCQPDGIPDECQVPPLDMAAPDCNENQIPDDCEADCNHNDYPDECDLTDGISDDCNSDAIPDECEPDEDEDGVIDDCDSCLGTPPGLIVTPDGCVVPFGPCCFDSGVCIDERTGAECALVSGEFLGDGLTCAGDPDGDGITGCDDCCPLDPNKTQPGDCGCGTPDVDLDDDGVLDCVDNCALANSDQQDCQPNGIGDVCDIAEGTSGDCDIDSIPDECESDADEDGTIDDCDNCPGDSDKTEPGICGCGVADTDTDEDDVPDCVDGCPDDSNKTDPGVCGCGVADADSDNDGVMDCEDHCAETSFGTPVNRCGCLAEGACCFPVGACWDDLNGEDCLAIGGLYQGDGSICADGCSFGDLDSDGDVDLLDVAAFYQCFTGGNGGAVAAECEQGNVDGCGAIGLADFRFFKTAITGP